MQARKNRIKVAGAVITTMTVVVSALVFLSPILSTALTDLQMLQLLKDTGKLLTISILLLIPPPKQ